MEQLQKDQMFQSTIEKLIQENSVLRARAQAESNNLQQETNKKMDLEGKIANYESEIQYLQTIHGVSSIDSISLRYPRYKEFLLELESMMQG